MVRSNFHQLWDVADILIEDRSYLEWIANADFSREIKEIVSKTLDGEFPEP